MQRSAAIGPLDEFCGFIRQLSTEPPHGFGVESQLDINGTVTNESTECTAEVFLDVEAFRRSELCLR